MKLLCIYADQIPGTYARVRSLCGREVSNNYDSVVGVGQVVSPEPIPVLREWIRSLKQSEALCPDCLTRFEGE